MREQYINAMLAALMVGVVIWGSVASCGPERAGAEEGSSGKAIEGKLVLGVNLAIEGKKDVVRTWNYRMTTKGPGGLDGTCGIIRRYACFDCPGNGVGHVAYGYNGVAPGSALGMETFKVSRVLSAEELQTFLKERGFVVETCVFIPIKQGPEKNYPEYLGRPIVLYSYLWKVGEDKLALRRELRYVGVEKAGHPSGLKVFSVPAEGEEGLACSPKLDPGVLKVSTARIGKEIGSW